MSTLVFVNEPVVVESRFLPGGEIEPTAFIWQGQTRRIVDHGRQWQEEDGGQTWHCYLVRSASNETFELKLDPAGGRWVLGRAWLGEERV